MLSVRCGNCGLPFPPSGFPDRCANCGGMYQITDFLEPVDVAPENPGIWRYWRSFGLRDYHPEIYLGEGNTPLIWDDLDGIRIAYKMESQNPTGSYKDRGTAVLIGQLLERGITDVVEDSSGNAGSSLACYAARSEMHARIYIPEAASGPKKMQMEQYGAEVVTVPGPREAAAEAVQQAVSAGAVYASHAYAPFGLAGIATIAYEALIQTEGNCGSILAPVGHGGLLTGILLGLEALSHAGQLKEFPRVVGVQSSHCSPAYHQFLDRAYPSDGAKNTVAEGIAVPHPVRAGEMIALLRRHQGGLVTVDEAEILQSRKELAHRGIFAEPTSATVWAAAKKLRTRLPEPVILIITGSGLKNTNE